MTKFYDVGRAKLAALAGLATALCVALSLAFVDAASAAATYDLDPVTTGIVDQVQDALTTILPIAGGLLALFVGWRVIKRMTKA